MPNLWYLPCTSSVWHLCYLAFWRFFVDQPLLFGTSNVCCIVKFKSIIYIQKEQLKNVANAKKRQSRNAVNINITQMTVAKQQVKKLHFVMLFLY